MAAIAVGMLVLAAGCGSGGESGQDRVRAAAEATRKAGTAGLTGSVAIGEDVGENVGTGADEPAFAAEGSVDFGANRGQLQLDLRALGLGKVDAVFEGASIFARNPLGALPLVRSWVGTDLSELAGVVGLSDDSLAPVEKHGLLTGLDYLGGATGVTKVGTEVLRGEDTTRYHATIDLAAAAERAPSETAREFRRAAESGAVGLAADVWLDGEGRVRRVDLVTSPTDGSTPSRLSVELYDFGTTVEVDIPDPKDVGSLLDLLG